VYASSSKNNQYSCQNLINLSGWNLEEYQNIRFNKNPSIGNQAVPFGQKDKPTDLTKLIVAFRNFANAPKIPKEQGF
jgi:hypothetical protein